MIKRTEGVSTTSFIGRLLQVPPANTTRQIRLPRGPSTHASQENGGRNMVAYHRCTSPLHITIAYHRCSPLHVTVVLGQAVGPADAAADPAEAEGGEQRPWRLLLMRKPEQGAAQGCGHDSSVAGQRTGRRCRCHTCRCQRLCCRPAPGFRGSRLGCGRSGQPRGWSTWTGPSTASMWCILAAALLLFASVVSCCTDLTVVPFCASDPPNGWGHAGPRAFPGARKGTG